MGAGVVVLSHLNHRKRDAHANFLIKEDLHMIGAIFLELNASEEMDVGGMGVEIAQTEGDFRLGDSLILLRIIDEALLDEVPATAAPACPEAEFKKTDWHVGCRDRADHSDECLLAAEFGPDILTEDGGLQVG